MAGQLGKAYDDFITARYDYVGDECYDAAVFGDFGMGAAWSTFNSAWSGEMAVISEAISELIDKVSTTVHKYNSTENHIIGTINAVGPR